MIRKTLFNFIGISFVFMSFLFLLTGQAALSSFTGYAILSSAISPNINYFYFLWFLFAGLMAFILSGNAK